MTRIRRTLIWLSRLNHCRGFGIQSPWAYSLVRYVLNEHFPYYSYEDLALNIPELNVIDRKLCELYFRLANYRQPSKILLSKSDGEASAEYMLRGCNKALVKKQLSSGSCDIDEVELAVVSLEGNYRDCYESLLSRVNDTSIIVLEGIYGNKATRRFWKSVVNDDRTGVTFDLYYCGIVFFDKKRYKQNYIINF